MASRLELFLGIVVFLAVFTAALLFLVQGPLEKKYSFEAVEEGIVFHSNESKPSEFLLSLKDRNEFVIVISSESQNESLTFKGNTMIMFQSILTANGKKAISLIKSLDNGKLLGCSTNYGLVEVGKEISPAECLEMLDSNNAFVFIENPNAELEKPEVVLEKNSIFIKSRTNQEMQSMGFSVLKIMYSDSEQIIAQINNFLQNAK